jgi:hypothetical protein
MQVGRVASIFAQEAVTRANGIMNRAGNQVPEAQGQMESQFAGLMRLTQGPRIPASKKYFLTFLTMPLVR